MVLTYPHTTCVNIYIYQYGGTLTSLMSSDSSAGTTRRQQWSFPCCNPTKKWIRNKRSIFIKNTPCSRHGLKGGIRLTRHVYHGKKTQWNGRNWVNFGHRPSICSTLQWFASTSASSCGKTHGRGIAGLVRCLEPSIWILSPTTITQYTHTHT